MADFVYVPPEDGLDVPDVMFWLRSRTILKNWKEEIAPGTKIKPVDPVKTPESEGVPLRITAPNDLDAAAALVASIDFMPPPLEKWKLGKLDSSFEPPKPFDAG